MEQEQKKSQGISWEILPPLAFALLFAWSLYSGEVNLNKTLFFLPALLVLLYVLVFKNAWLPALLLLFVPLSVSTAIGAGIIVEFPTEIMVALTALVFLGQSLLFPGRFAKIIRHPLVVLALLGIAWMLVCSIQSNMPLVSFKRSFVKLAYLFSFLLIFARWFGNEKNRMYFFFFYIIGCLYPIAHTIISQSKLGFAPVTAYWMPKPYFNDHTIYGACLAFLLPALFIFLFSRKVFRFSTPVYAGIIGLLLILLTAEILSFSRAAWVSLAGSAIFAVLVRFRIRAWLIVSFIFLAASILVINREAIYELARNNEAVSSKGTLEDHILSVTNIQTDASNTERINRWNSALRMANEKPIFGFGPGMYQFEYGRFQLSTELTSISTFSGNRGNAHSEILGALAETGYPGMILEILLLFTGIGYGLKVVYATNDPFRKRLALAALLGLVSFYVHGFFNAFMDTEKMAILVYGSLALIIATDIENRKNAAELKKTLPENG